MSITSRHLRRRGAIPRTSSRLRWFKPSERRWIERLARRRVPPDAVCSTELARELAELGHTIGRRMGLLIDRRGRVIEVVIGERRRLPFDQVPPGRSAAGRLRGLRLVTTIAQGDAARADGPTAEVPGQLAPDLTTLLRERLDLVLWVGVGEDGLPVWTRRAHLLPDNAEGRVHEVEPARPPGQDPADFLEFIANLEAELERTAPEAVENPDGERAILVCFDRRERRPERLPGEPPPPRTAEWSLRELEDLVRTSGGEPMQSLVQRRAKPDAATLVGPGFVRRLQERVLATAATVVVFDGELSPSQARNLESALDCKVIDRTQVILDIFAQRARTAEGRHQVELARLRYLLPRLIGAGEALSRLGGGIGSSRGLGEKKLELDRRYVARRVATLERRLRAVVRHRETTRRERDRSGLRQVALTGYTNAGKSTLFNALCTAEVLAEKRLFATLDPTARRMASAADASADAPTVILGDTVGFIRELPESLFTAFRATFEEVCSADLLVLVADAADPHVFAELKVTEHLLERLGVGEVPRLIVFNKRDLVEPAAFAPLARDALGGRPWLLVSALDPASVDRVRATILNALAS